MTCFVCRKVSNFTTFGTSSTSYISLSRMLKKESSGKGDGDLVFPPDAAVKRPCVHNKGPGHLKTPHVFLKQSGGGKKTDTILFSVSPKLK